MENEIDFLKKIIVEHYQLERQMVQMEILLVLSGFKLIWVQAVISKGYQQTTKVASSKEDFFVMFVFHTHSITLLVFFK